MKNSGIEWIGNIPDDWKLESLKGHLEEVKESNDPVQTTQVLSLTNKLGVIPYEEKGEQGNKAKENYNEYKLAYPNTIVANSMNILIGSVGRCNYFGCVSPVYYVFKPKNENELKFLDYIFQSQPFQKELRRYAKGILEIRLRVSASDILRRQVAFPTIEKQKQITAFIDEKCGKIDELIANQEKQIEKLKEYKQSVITEAVTKGLDKSAPLKDSGIEWIGEIPENYIICKIKHILDNSDFGIKCGPFGSALTGKVVDNGSVLIYGQWNVVDGNFNKKRNTIAGKDFDDLSAYEVLPGDILVSMMGTIGKCAIVPTDISRGIMDSHIIKIRLNNNVVLHKFFEYQYDKDNSFIVYEYFKRVKKGFIMDGLNTTLIKNAFFILPSLYEQQQIVDYLDEKCGKIDRLIAIKQEKIEKLQEYKKSLIYEYVTGKKEVV